MRWLRAIVVALFSLSAFDAALAGTDASASAWLQGHHSRVRMVAGGADLAAIEIVLDRGFKTYWRTPGESGLPPAFDWSGSENLAKVDVLWPAPRRFEDVGGVSYGYTDRLILPLRVTALQPGQPVRIMLKLDYGVCKDICIPAQATMSRTLGPSGAGRALIEEAIARVPKPKPLGAAGDLAILALKPMQIDGRSAIAIFVRVPASADPSLFVEAPNNWYLAATGGFRPTSDPPPNSNGQFLVEVFERPRDATGSVDLRFTLVTGDRAIETEASLDTALLPR